MHRGASIERMGDGDARSPGVARFIEAMGLYFEEAGIPRIGGRLLALLMTADRPLSLDEAADRLSVSRASISTNARLIITAGLIERVSLPGDRRDYYAFTERAWEDTLQAEIRNIARLRRIVAEGLASLGTADPLVSARLREALAFSEFCAAEFAAMAERWRVHRATVLNEPPSPSVP